MVRLVDETADVFCSEDVRGRMDLFLAELSNQPGSIGYIIGSADAEMPGRYPKYERALRNHVTFRRFDPSRVKFLRGPDGDAMRFVYRLVPDGARTHDLPVPYRRSKINKPTLFDESGIVRVKGGKVQFGEKDGGAAEPCDWGLRLEDYAAALKADEYLIGHLIGSSGSSERNKVRTSLSLTAALMSREFGIPKQRIVTRLTANDGPSTMRLWLVPRGTKLDLLSIQPKKHK